MGETGESWQVVARDATGNKSEWLCGKDTHPTFEEAQQEISAAIAEETGAPPRVVLVRVK